MEVAKRPPWAATQTRFLLHRRWWLVCLTLLSSCHKLDVTRLEHLCHKYEHQCVVIISPCHPRAKVLSPLSQPQLDAAMTMVTGAIFQLGRHVTSPITLQYLQRNYHVIKDAFLVLPLGYFDNFRKHVLGGTGWTVAMAQMLHKPLYVFDADMEQWYWWNPTLGQYQPSEGMTETQVCNPTLQDHTAIVETQEQVSVIYPTLDNLFNNNSQAM